MAMPPGGTLTLVGFFTTALITGFSGAVMPGPMTTVALAHIARRGAIAGPLVAVGHAVAEAALVTALALGAAAVFVSGSVTGSIAVVGALVLGWMGWGLLGEGRSSGWTAATAEESGQRCGPVWSGVLTSVTNPAWYVWWSTVGIGYFALVRPWGALGIVTFFLGHVLADFTWFTLMGLAFARGRTVLTPRMYRGLLQVLGVFLLVMAAGFLWFGAERLAGV
jgi:threonine/homoserine/homoserine lactone efflux protein